MSQQVDLSIEELGDLILSLDGNANMIETGSWDFIDPENVPEEEEARIREELKVRLQGLAVDELEHLIRLKKLKLKLRMARHAEANRMQAQPYIKKDDPHGMSGKGDRRLAVSPRRKEADDSPTSVLARNSQ